MKTFRCRAIGYDCDFEAQEDTEEEVLKIVTEHLKAVHDWRDPTISLEDTTTIKRLIVEERTRQLTKTSLIIDGTNAAEIHRKEQKS